MRSNIPVLLSTTVLLSISCRTRQDNRERDLFETIQKQTKASGAKLNSGGPFLPNAQQLAFDLERQLPRGRIHDEGKYGPAPAWKRVELSTEDWNLEILVRPDMRSAAREMANYIRNISAWPRPGTMSGVPVGQARYSYGSDAIVFLRQNVIVWVRGDLDRSRRGLNITEEANRCEEIAGRVDREILSLLSKK
jgi:hypothetical protein